MKLEDQVCSLELSRRLKELGVKQEGLWWWVGDKLLSADDRFDLDERHKYTVGEVCVANTVAELGDFFAKEKLGTSLPYYSLVDKEWSVRIKTEDLKADTEANVRAKMLIYLLEKGLVRV